MASCIGLQGREQKKRQSSHCADNRGQTGQDRAGQAAVGSEHRMEYAHARYRGLPPVDRDREHAASEKGQQQQHHQQSQQRFRFERDRERERDRDRDR